MKIAILGYGKQGKSAFEYWSKPGNEITICDKDAAPDIPPGIATQIGSDYLYNLDSFDLLVRTPALHPREISLANPEHPNILQKVTTVTNEFFAVCPTKNIIGVTGTKGKGTTSTLIARILEAAGKHVHIGGNIGTPPLDMLKTSIATDDWVVLELANFQLIDLRYSPHIGVCLMIAPEHLNWHQDMYEYVHSKEQMFAAQSANDIAVYNANNEYSLEIVSAAKAAHKIPYEVPPLEQTPNNTDGAYVRGNHVFMRGQVVCNTDDMQLLGRHNLQNICAAVAATWDIIEGNHRLIKKVIKEFTGLPHRLEYVGNIGKRQYFNDSFASAPDAAMAAMSAIQGPKVMIMGGYDRNLDLTNLVAAVVAQAATIRKIILIGESAPRFAEALREKQFVNYEVLPTNRSMQNVVAEATHLAVAGDKVLLSPGFPSFDMFKNFEDRGEQFKAAVKGLSEQ